MPLENIREGVHEAVDLKSGELLVAACGMVLTDDKKHLFFMPKFRAV